MLSDLGDILSQCFGFEVSRLCLTVSASCSRYGSVYFGGGGGGGVSMHV